MLPGRRRPGRGARPDHGARGVPGAVRPAAGHVPGRGPAGRRRLHRLADPAPGHAVGLLAAGHGARGRHRPRRGRVLAGRAGARRRCGPVTTCMAASAWTSPTRCTATRRWSRTWPGSWAAWTTGSTSSAPGPGWIGRHVPRAHRRPGRAARRAAGVFRRADLRRRAGRDADRAARRCLPRGRAADGPRRLAWRGLAREYGGRGLGPVEQQIFASEAARADVPLPAVTLQTVGPTLQAHGTSRAEGLLPAPDPGRRGALRDRLHRAGGGHRPGRAAHPRGAGRGLLRGQRPEDLHHRGPRRRLHLAGLPHRPGRAAAQGHLHPDRGHHRTRVLLDADHHPRRGPSRQRDLLLRRTGPGHDAGRGGERAAGGW